MAGAAVNYPTALVPGTVVRRYKRYLIDVELADGTVVTAHCPNPGRMTSCMADGAPCRLQYTASPKRKLDWTLEQVRIGDTWIGVHPRLANDVVDEALQAERVPALAGADRIEREVRSDDSRVDFRVWHGDTATWVEVKQVTLCQDDGWAAFPDAVTARGLKHLGSLVRRIEAGDRAMLLFAVARGDVDAVRPAESVDPAYAAGLRDAVARGLGIVAHHIDVREDGLVLGDELPVYVDGKR